MMTDALPSPGRPAIFTALRRRWVTGPLVCLLSAAIVGAGMLLSWEVALANPAPPGGPRGVDQGAAEARSFRPSVMPNPFALSTGDAAGNVTLFPGSPNQLDLSASSLFPGTAAVSPADVAAQSRNPTALEAWGVANRPALEAEASATGEAFRTVIDSRRLIPPDLRNDPVFGTTRAVLNDIDALGRSFADCTINRTIVPGANPGVGRIPDLQTCERALDLTGTVTVDHLYTPNVIVPRSGNATLQPCGPGCVDVWIGRVGDNYYNTGSVNSCRVFDESIRFAVLNPGAVISAIIEQVVVDDHLRVVIDGATAYQTPWGWPVGGGCEQNVNNNFPTSVDVTAHIAQPGDRDFRISTLVGWRGEGFVRMRIRYDASRAVMQDVWTPAADVRRLLSVSDGFCSLTAIRCDDMPPLDAGGCTMIAGARVCPDMLPSAESAIVANHVNPLCRRLTFGLSCNFWQGQMPCFVDAQGVQRCPDNVGAPADGCSSLRANPRCGFASTRCVQDGEGASGTCYIQEDTYDCGLNVSVPTIGTDTRIDCAGPLRCLGSDCVDLQFESNANFAQVAAALQGLSLIGSDGECDPVTGSCIVFRGNARTCKRAVGGLVNCCNQPGGVSLGDYLRLIMNVRSVDSAVMTLEAGGALRGAWETLRNPIVDAYSSAQELWTSTVNSVTGRTAAAASDPAAQGILATAKQAMMQATVEWTTNLFGPQAANMLFSAVDGVVVGPAVDVATGAINTGTLQLGGGGAIVGSVLSFAVAAYAIYQVFTILVQIIWACERDEFDLAVKRQLRSCHMVGSYCNTSVLGVCIERRESHCCFASPLSRILQQQMRPQLGRGWGTPRQPDCSGLTIAEMGSIDWQRVDLSEWVAILASEGMLPDPLAMTPERLTGVGRSALDAADPTSVRRTVEQRTIDRLLGLDVQGLQTQGRGQVRTMQGLP
jgi:conjugal transfer mating pair stabilization protein TraN